VKRLTEGSVLSGRRPQTARARGGGGGGAAAQQGVARRRRGARAGWPRLLLLRETETPTPAVADSPRGTEVNSLHTHASQRRLREAVEARLAAATCCCDAYAAALTHAHLCAYICGSALSALRALQAPRRGQPPQPLNALGLAALCQFSCGRSLYIAGGAELRAAQPRRAGAVAWLIGSVAFLTGSVSSAMGAVGAEEERDAEQGQAEARSSEAQC